MAERKKEDLTQRYGPYISPVTGMMEQQPMMLGHPQGHLLMQQHHYSQPGYTHQALMRMQQPMAYTPMQAPVSVRSVAAMSQQPSTYGQAMQQQIETSQQQQQLQQALLQQQMLLQQKQQQQQQQQTSQVQPSAALLAQLQRQQMSPQQPGHIYHQQQPF